MDAFAFYSVSTSGWLALQAVPQLITPSMILQLLTTDESKPDDLLIYIARCESLAQLALAALSLLLSGLLSSSASSTQPEVSALATPAAVLTTAYHFLAAFHAYGAYATGGQASFALGVVGSGALAALGTWAVLFGGGSHVSRRTGRDKRTSGFPFGDRKGRAEGLKEN